MNDRLVTLRRRMIVQIGSMVVCSLLIAAGAIAGIEGVHQDFGVAVQGYRQLRQVYDVGFRVAGAKQAISGSMPDPDKARAALQSAELKLEQSYYEGDPDTSPRWLDESNRVECEALLKSALAHWDDSPSPDTARFHQIASINSALGKIATLSTGIRTAITARQVKANRDRHTALVLILSLSAALMLVAVIVGARLYRSVVKPLDRLAKGVRVFAAGKFDDRITMQGDREFISLANDFNHMAAELQTLYRDLERKVEAKSKELVRSERLASVGYLAAGVAHEINNPLSIITGYAERSLQLLDRGLDDGTLPRTRKSIEIMCEEAFRCKGITDRLLALARPGNAEDGPVSLGAIAQDVIRNIGGLPEYSNRRITLAANDDEDSTVIAKDGEIKQVVMNLLLNALEAVEAKIGHVHLEVARAGDSVELSVTDNGRGMSPATLDRIFEPFYTESRGRRQGVGLGLSITHAIVTGRGGSITAESNGVGQGSRFNVCWPAARKGAELVHSTT